MSSDIVKQEGYVRADPQEEMEKEQEIPRSINVDGEMRGVVLATSRWTCG
jgi:hypothetical protein